MSKNDGRENKGKANRALIQIRSEIWKERQEMKYGRKDRK